MKDTSVFLTLSQFKTSAKNDEFTKEIDEQLFLFLPIHYIQLYTPNTYFQNNLESLLFLIDMFHWIQNPTNKISKENLYA